MEKNMENDMATGMIGIYRGYIGIMDKKSEATILVLGFRV